MDYTIEQKKVFDDILQELRESEERLGRKAVRIRYWTNRYWDRIEMPWETMLSPGMIVRLKSVGIVPEISKTGVTKKRKYLTLKKN